MSDRVSDEEFAEAERREERARQLAGADQRGGATMKISESGRGRAAEQANSHTKNAEQHEAAMAWHMAKAAERHEAAMAWQAMDDAARGERRARLMARAQAHREEGARHAARAQHERERAARWEYLATAPDAPAFLGGQNDPTSAERNAGERFTVTGDPAPLPVEAILEG